MGVYAIKVLAALAPLAGSVAVQVPDDALNGVPKIIHQTWKTAELPERFQRWSESWRACLPGWELRLHTDEDNRRLIEEHFPDLLAMYDGFASPIMRVDMARYAYMAVAGGVYVDLDIECLRNPLSVIEASSGIAQVVLACEGGRQASNAILMANAGAGRVFFRQVVNALPQAQEDTAAMELEGRILGGTGPQFLTKFLDGHNVDWHSAPDVIENVIGPYGTRIAVLDDSLVFGIKWYDEEAKQACLSREACMERFPKAITVSHWTASWKKPLLADVVTNRAVGQASNSTELHGTPVGQCECLEELLFAEGQGACGAALGARLGRALERHGATATARTKMMDCLNVYLASCGAGHSNSTGEVGDALTEVFEDGGRADRNESRQG